MLGTLLPPSTLIIYHLSNPIRNDKSKNRVEIADMQLVGARYIYIYILIYSNSAICIDLYILICIFIKIDTK